ncbi:MAG: sulfatase-like hydrolase/transferase [Geminicoccaceae bacterium]
MSKAPNLLFLFSDQHAAKVAGCYGDPLVQTPNLDRLAARGVTFDNAYCPAPICVPSRMALHTGRWPKNQHVWINSDMLPSDLPTMAHSLAISGRRPTLVGRMHSLGPDQLRGYSERLVGDHSSNWPGIGSNHDMGPLGHAHLPNRDSLSNAGCGQSSYEAHDVDVVEAACAHLDALGQRRRSGDATPFAATVGFMLPHNPYVARPEDYRLYEGKVGLPGVPAAPAGEEHPYIAAWRDHSGCRDVDEASILRARTAYYGLVTRLGLSDGANVTMIDDSIEALLKSLEARGYLENAVVFFASDHGDCMGDHGMIQKWSMYDCVTRTPLIAWSPGRFEAGRKVDGLCQLFDLGPTILELAGCEVPEELRGALAGAGARGPGWQERAHVFCEQAGDTNLTGSEFITMVRDRRHKLVHFKGAAFGQLFDLEADPGRSRNLWDDPGHAEIRAELLAVLRDWLIEEQLPDPRLDGGAPVGRPWRERASPSSTSSSWGQARRAACSPTASPPTRSAVSCCWRRAAGTGTPGSTSRAASSRPSGTRT